MHPAVERYLERCLEHASLARRDEREVREELLSGLEFLTTEAEELPTDEVYAMIEQEFGPAAEIGRSIANAKGRFRTYLKKEWRKTLISIPIILVAFFLVRGFVAQTFVVASSSMSPVIPKGERVIVNKLAYTFGEPSEGELIVYRDAEGKAIIAKVESEEAEALTVSKLATDFRTSIERSALIGKVWVVTH